MKRCGSVLALGFVFLVATAVAAAELWEKPFLTWSDKELKGFLEESPWAGKASLTYAKAGGGLSAIDDTVRVTWESALPMRQARVREKVGQNGTLTPDMESFLAAPQGSYDLVFRVEGTSAMMAAMQMVPIAKETFIKRDGKPPIPVVRVQSVRLDKNGKPIETPAPGRRGQAPGAGDPAEGQAAPGAQAAPEGQAGAAGPGGGGGGRGGRGGGGFGGGGFGGGGGSTLLVFTFGKTDPITLDDKEVEVVSKVGQFNVKKKFKLKEMTVNGALAL